MENTKTMKLAPEPFKTYLLGYYAVQGDCEVTDQKTGEVKKIHVDKFELHLLTPIDIEKWGATSFVGSSVSVVSLPREKAFAYFGVAPNEFSPEKCLMPLVGCPIKLISAPDGKGKMKLRGIQADI